MLIFTYPSKKAMKEAIGKSLRFEETSIFGPEYRATGTFCGSNRPSITRIKNPKTGKLAGEFFAEVKMVDGLIASVK